MRAICIMVSAVSAIGTSRYLLRDIQPWLAAFDVERAGKLTVKASASRWLSDWVRRPAPTVHLPNP